MFVFERQIENAKINYLCPVVEEKTDDKDITLDQFSSYLSHIFHNLYESYVIEIRAIPQNFCLKNDATSDQWLRRSPTTTITNRAKARLNVITSKQNRIFWS